MTTQRLSFEQSPPLAVPLRFFLTAPLFGLLAAAVIAWGGADAFDSRWTPSLLAATHLVTLGFLTMVMSGALLQVLPIVVGAAVPMLRLTAAGVHLPLAAGTLVLAVGLGADAPALLQLGLPLLAAALGVLLAAVAVWIAGRFLPDFAQAPVHGLLLGILMVGGFAVSVVNGMLYKIAPFLAWLAMQNEAHGLAVPPNIKRILPDTWMRWQARLHLLALALLLGAAVWPHTLVYPAVAAYAASSAFLWRNIVQVYRVHRRFARALHEALAAQ